MKLYHSESRFMKGLPNWAIELTLGVSGVCFAIITIQVGRLIALHPIFVYMSYFIGFVGLLKICIVVVSLIQRREV